MCQSLQRQLDGVRHLPAALDVSLCCCCRCCLFVACCCLLAKRAVAKRAAVPDVSVSAMVLRWKNKTPLTLSLAEAGDAMRHALVNEA